MTKPRQNRRSTQQLVMIGLLTAIAAILGYLESLLPPFVPIPGVKIGLANIVTMFALIFFSLPTAALIVTARTILVGFLFGSFSSLLYSLAGGLLSCLVMGLCFHQNRLSEALGKAKPFSIFGISILGAVTHNIGQLLVAAIVIQNTQLILSYLPFLILLAIPIGLLTGFITKRLMPYFSRIQNHIK